jgi:integrase
MRFLNWLASTQPGYKSRIRRDDIDYMNLSEKAVRAASAPRDRDYPTLRMIETAIDLMPHETSIEKRDRALVALSALTAIRVKALTTLKLKHFDKRRLLIIQQPDQVETKFSKRINTFLMPVSTRIEAIFLSWIDHLQTVELYGPGDPIFPQTRMGQDANRQFTAIGLERVHWHQTASARAIIQDAFEAAGLPRFGPHSFRDMIVSEMYSRDLSIAAFRAGSQNLGHEQVLTTLISYGKLSLEEHGRLIRLEMSLPPEDESVSF